LFGSRLLAATILSALAVSTSASAQTVFRNRASGPIIITPAGLRVFSLASQARSYPAFPSRAHPETVLFAFNGENGRSPNALVRDERGDLFGTTSGGGTTDNCGSGGCGTVFELTPPGPGRPSWTQRVLYSFIGGADGGLPLSGLILDQHGALYGTTFSGAINNPKLFFRRLRHGL
jgi:hypothetical protein